MTVRDTPDEPPAGDRTEVHRYRTDENEHPSEGVFAALDSLADDALAPERPIADHVDLDALDDLFVRDRGTAPEGHVVFAHGEYGVRVTADGTVVAWRRDAD
jgi:hypothetical protein